MTTRNFKQRGQAYGSTPASITATIDGTVVYSGPISTLDTPLPIRPGVANVSIPTIFTWTNNVDFAGTQSYSIAVIGSQLLLDCTLADHCVANNVAQFDTPYIYETDGVNPGGMFPHGPGMPVEVGSPAWWEAVRKMRQILNNPNWLPFMNPYWLEQWTQQGNSWPPQEP